MSSQVRRTPSGLCFRDLGMTAITAAWAEIAIQDFRSLGLRPRLAEIHQFPDGTIVETLHACAPLELLDRDFASEAVIGAIKADQPSDDPLEQRRAFGEDGLKNGLFALKRDEIAQIGIV